MKETRINLNSVFGKKKSIIIFFLEKMYVYSCITSSGITTAVTLSFLTLQ